MDERKIIERLAEIREMFPPGHSFAAAALDRLMQDMLFGNNWPHGDATPEKPAPAPEQPRKMEFFL